MRAMIILVAMTTLLPGGQGAAEPVRAPVAQPGDCATGGGALGNWLFSL